MKISELKKAAAARLGRYGKRPYKLAFFAFAIAMGAQFLVAAMSFAASSYQGASGLDGMGAASFLQTLEELLGTAVQLLSPLWVLGFTAAIMAFMDWQDPEDKVLLTGLRRCWSFAKLYMLEAVLLTLIAIAVYLPVSILYSMTPWAQEMVNLPDPEIVGEVKFLAAAFDAAGPLLIMYALALIAVLVPLMYRLRFTNYMILHGWIGVMNAMTTSFALTKGRCFTMFKLDLSYWWYYLASGLLTGVYIAVPLLSLDLGLSTTAAFWLSLIAYALGSLALDVFARPRIIAANVLLYRGATGKE